MTFPEEQMVYDAAHRETIWRKKGAGVIISYSDSAELAGI